MPDSTIDSVDRKITSEAGHVLTRCNNVGGVNLSLGLGGMRRVSRVESRVIKVLTPPVVLALLAAASALPYIFGIGFYSDDWAFLSALHQSAQVDFASRYALLAENSNLAVRPTQ